MKINKQILKEIITKVIENNSSYVYMLKYKGGPSDYDDEIIEDEIIGIFSTSSLAQKALEKIESNEMFRKHSYTIEPIELNKIIS